MFGKPDRFSELRWGRTALRWVMSLSAVLTVRKPPSPIAVPGHTSCSKLSTIGDRFDGSIVTAIIQDLQQGAEGHGYSSPDTTTI